MRIRSHLMLFVALSILPVIAFSAVMTVVLWRQQRAAIERGYLDGVRAMAIALDRAHSGIIQSLRVLSHSVYLDSADLRGFERQAGRILAGEPMWADLVLTDLDGRVLLDLRPTMGAAAASLVADPVFRELVTTERPVVSNLEGPPASPTYVTSIGVPVIRGGRLQFALFAVVDQTVWHRLMASYPTPRNATMTLLGRDGIIIARTLNPTQWIGQLPSPGLREHAEQSPEGAYRNVGLEGQWFFTAHSRAKLSGWTVATGVPVADVQASLKEIGLALTGGAVLAVLAAVGVAFVLGRRISRPVSALAGAAASVGRGQPPSGSAHDTHITEVDEVAAALESAGTRIREREDERAALLTREQAARADAEAASRAKDEFLAVLSHELRTPINAVYGWARMLQRGQVDRAQLPHAVDVIVRNSNAQIQLIDDLLDVSRIITGKLRLDVRRTDLAAVVEAALDAVRPAAEAKGVRIESVLDPRTDPISGDPARLQQVVWNLLINSVKFTPKGGRVQIVLQRADSHVEIVVSDTGQGIAPELLTYIFERFTQVDAGTTRAHGGLGLGLALVRHLVELHGGTVTAVSAGPGLGSTFTVRLPVALARVDDAPSARAAGPASAGPSLKGIHVLVVDDDRDALELASAILSAAGAEVHMAASAAEALSVFDTRRPDVLLSDIEMPDEDGYTLIQKLRARGRADGGRTPAVALTAYGRAEDRVRTLSAGFNMHLPKPVDPAELVAVTAALTGR